MDNLSVAKRAFSTLFERTPGRPVQDIEELPLWECMTDDVVWTFSCAEDMPIFGVDRVGKQDIMELGRVEREILEKPQGIDSAPEFICSEDQVVMLLVHSYKIKSSGVSVDRRMTAMVMDFRDGLISRIRFYEDLSEIRDAFRNERPS